MGNEPTNVVIDDVSHHAENTTSRTKESGTKTPHGEHVLLPSPKGILQLPVRPASMPPARSKTEHEETRCVDNLEHNWRPSGSSKPTPTPTSSLTIQFQTTLSSNTCEERRLHGTMIVLLHNSSSLLRNGVTPPLVFPCCPSTRTHPRSRKTPHLRSRTSALLT